MFKQSLYIIRDPKPPNQTQNIETDGKIRRRAILNLFHQVAHNVGK